MTLLKRFMGWDTGLNITKPPQVSSPQFRALYWRLLLSYLGAMATIVGISTAIVYQVVAQSLYERFDGQLTDLAASAAHSLAEIAADPGAIDRKITVFDNDGDFDLPWQDIRAAGQTIEWFNEQHQPLAIVGDRPPQTIGGNGFQTWQFAHLRAFTIPVY
ncbi:MAG TPA: hypothetical protein V6C57_24715, partial [Coleofasciculaceae cyanobacterium]